MEYYSVRVKLSACESNRLGVSNPLFMVKINKSVFAQTIKYKDSAQPAQI